MHRCIAECRINSGLFGLHADKRTYCGGGPRGTGFIRDLRSCGDRVPLFMIGFRYS
jgi:hypothetical protein